MTLADQIFLIIIAASLLASALTRWATYLQDHHDSSMARIVGFGGRIAAEISAVLRDLPPGADVAVVRQSLIAAGVAEARGEFAPEIKVVGGTDAKIAGIISREVDKVVGGAPVAAAVGELATAIVPAVLEAVPAAA